MVLPTTFESKLRLSSKFMCSMASTPSGVGGVEAKRGHPTKFKGAGVHPTN